MRNFKNYEYEGILKRIKDLEEQLAEDYDAEKSSNSSVTSPKMGEVKSEPEIMVEDIKVEDSVSSHQAS